MGGGGGSWGIDRPKEITRAGSDDVKTYRRFPLCLPSIGESGRREREETKEDRESIDRGSATWWRQTRLLPRAEVRQSG